MPVFGYDTQGSTIVSSFDTGRKYGTLFTLIEDGTVTELHCWIERVASSNSATLSIYTDNAGSPDVLEFCSSLIPWDASSPGAFEISATGLSVPLTAGDYWLTWASTTFDGVSGVYGEDPGGTHKGIISGAAVNPQSNPFGSPGTSGSRKHSIWAVYTVPCDPPTNDTPPSIAGDDVVGDTLTYTPGGWSGTGTITVDWDWYRLCGTVEDLVQSGGSTYDTVVDDIGCNIFVRETAEDDDCPGEFAFADSNEIGPILEAPAPPVNITPPVVSGAGIPGHVLETTDGTWSGSPTSFTYQWEMDCGGGYVELVGETSDTLLVDEGMVGCQVRCVVTAHNDEGDTEANSNSILVEANVPAAVRFCHGPLWRFVVTDLDTQVLTWLDRLATERSVVLTLNAPAVAAGVVPSDAPQVNILHTDGDPFVNPGNRLLYGFRQEVVGGEVQWVVRYAGVIQQMEDIADSDNANTTYTAFDPLKYLFQRPVQTIEGNPVGVNGLSFDDTRVDVIIGTLLSNTIVNNGTTRIDMGALYGGTGFYAGTIESLPQIDINFQQGSSVGDAIKQLTDQNLCDIILTPVYDPENRPGVCCDLSVYAQAGAVQEDAIFSWDKAPRSLVGISRLLDLSQMANKVKYFAGQGGTATNGQNVPLQTDATSVTKYGEYWSQQFWPGQNVASAVETLAIAALELQKNGKETVAISPMPGCTPLPFQEYFLGDRVPVYASSRFRQEIPTGAVQYQRIYGMPIDIADDSTEMIKQMLTSALQ